MKAVAGSEITVPGHFSAVAVVRAPWSKAQATPECWATLRQHEEFTLPAAEQGETMAESDEELKAELARLRAENEFLKEESKKGLRLQVSAKGGASLYGIRRFPITFYKDEWETILGKADDIRAFLAEHADELKKKN